MREQLDQFERRNVQILIVEPNAAYRLRYLVRRTSRSAETSVRPIDAFTAGMGAWLGKSGEPALTVVNDPAATVAASYGVAVSGKFNAGGEFFHRPATFLIDRDGMIRFMADYKDTEPLAAEELLAVLDDLEEKRSLIAALKHKEPALKDTIELVLQPALPEATKSLSMLAQALGDEDADVRTGAAAALCWLGFRAAPVVPQLAKSLDDRDPRVRFRAAEALARIGPAAAPAVATLIRVVKESDRQARAAFEQSLRDSPRRVQFVFPSIPAPMAISQDDVRLRAMAIAALERIGSGAATGLAEELADKDCRVRLRMTEVLGRFESQAQNAGPALAKLVRHDDDARVREAATMALHQLRHFDTALVAALRDDDAAVRAAAASALERTGGVGHWDAILALVAALDDQDKAVRDSAFYALDHRADGSVPTIIEALKNNDPQIRVRAAEIMALLWDKARALDGGRLMTGLRDEAAQALRVATKDPDARVSKAAAAALAKIAASTAKKAEK